MQPLQSLLQHLAANDERLALGEVVYVTIRLAKIMRAHRNQRLYLVPANVLVGRRVVGRRVHVDVDVDIDQTSLEWVQENAPRYYAYYAYMAPELLLNPADQQQQQQNVTTASTIWTLGMLLHFMLGGYPWPGQNETQIIIAMRTSTQPQLPQVLWTAANGSSEHQLADLLRACWQYDPSARPDSDEVYATLQSISALLPANDKATMLLCQGVNCLVGHEYEDALKALKDADEICQSQDSVILKFLGAAYLLKGDFENGSEKLEDAFDLAPQDGFTNAYWGVTVLFDRGDEVLESPIFAHSCQYFLSRTHASCTEITLKYYNYVKGLVVLHESLLAFAALKDNVLEDDLDHLIILCANEIDAHRDGALDEFLASCDVVNDLRAILFLEVFGP